MKPYNATQTALIRSCMAHHIARRRKRRQQIVAGALALTIATSACGAIGLGDTTRSPEQERGTKPAQALVAEVGQYGVYQKEVNDQ